MQLSTDIYLMEGACKMYFKPGIKFKTEGSQQYFIGRSGLINSLRTEFSDPEDPAKVCYSGLLRSGKTSVLYRLRHLMQRQFIDGSCSVLPVYLDITTFNNHCSDEREQFLSDIILKTVDAIEFNEKSEKLISCISIPFGQLREEANRISTMCMGDSRDKQCGLREWVKIWKEHNVSLLYMLDEFQALPQKCSSSQALYLLSNADISLLCMGRTTLRTILSQIEKQPRENVSTTGFLEQRAFQGYSDEDIIAYKNYMSDKLKLTPSKKMWEAIYNNTGRSPYLLAHYGKYIEQRLCEIEREELLQSNVSEWPIEVFHEYFADAKQQLIEDDNLKDLMTVILGGSLPKAEFIHLQTMGYLFYEKNMVFAISAYFTDYLRQNCVKNLILRIQKAEKLMSRMIMEELPNILPGIELLSVKQQNEALKSLPIAFQLCLPLKIDAQLYLYQDAWKRRFHGSRVINNLSLGAKVRIVVSYFDQFIKHFRDEDLEVWIGPFRSFGHVRDVESHVDGTSEEEIETRESILNGAKATGQIIDALEEEYGRKGDAIIV